MSPLRTAAGGGAGQHVPQRAMQAQSASDDDEVLFVGEYAPGGAGSRARCVLRGALRLKSCVDSTLWTLRAPNSVFQAAGRQRRSVAPPGAAAGCPRRRRRVWRPGRAAVRGSLPPLRLPMRIEAKSSGARLTHYCAPRPDAVRRTTRRLWRWRRGCRRRRTRQRTSGTAQRRSQLTPRRGGTRSTTVRCTTASAFTSRVLPARGTRRRQHAATPVRSASKTCCAPMQPPALCGVRC